MLPNDFKPFEYPFPASLTAWEKDIPILREKLWSLLGDLPRILFQLQRLWRRGRTGISRQKNHFR